MGTPFEQHVSALDQALFDELVARLGCFARLTTACQENATLLVLDRHEVGWDLDVDDVGPIAMRAEVVHVQVVSVVDEEMKRVQHLLVVADQRHFQVLIDDLLQLLLRLVLLMDQLDLRLLFRLLD